MVSCSGFGLPLHAQLLRLFVTLPSILHVIGAITVEPLRYTDASGPSQIPFTCAQCSHHAPPALENASELTPWPQQWNVSCHSASRVMQSFCNLSYIALPHNSVYSVPVLVDRSRERCEQLAEVTVSDISASTRLHLSVL